MAVIRRTTWAKYAASSGWGGRPSRGSFAVAEPLFENLIAAESVVPDVGGDSRPESGAVEMHVDAGFS